MSSGFNTDHKITIIVWFVPSHSSTTPPILGTTGLPITLLLFSSDSHVELPPVTKHLICFCFFFFFLIFCITLHYPPNLFTYLFVFLLPSRLTALSAVYIDFLGFFFTHQGFLLSPCEQTHFVVWTCANAGLMHYRYELFVYMPSCRVSNAAVVDYCVTQ